MIITGKDLQFALVAMSDVTAYYQEKAQNYKNQKGLKGKKRMIQYALENAEKAEILAQEIRKACWAELHSKITDEVK